MPLVNRTRFAEMCGWFGGDVKKLNVYISRGKVSVSIGNKKLIDTENPKNSAFISQWVMTNGLKAKGIDVPRPTKSPKEEKLKLVIKAGSANLPAPASQGVTRPAIKPQQPAQPRKIKQKEAYQQAKDQQYADMEVEKKQKDLEFLDLKIQREELLLNKSAGELLPIDLVTGMLKRHATTILKNFEKGCDNIASIYCNIMAGGDPKMLVRISKHMKKELSTCVLNAGKDADQEVDILVDEFSQTLLRGQRKV